ncbi:MAG: hypothetical protein M0P64_02180 [Candidatus Pacebacteria bacterium]|jgi:hypothetical protein|nr:hypothetical protein [Candidatus Paceibacterota bacterium]
MENIIKQLKKGSQHARLSSAEKTEMRSALLQYAKAHPVESSVLSSRAIVSPFSLSNFRNKKTISGLVIGGLLMSGSVSFAAEGALPGDILYPVKVSVNEGIRKAVAVTPEAKSALGVKLVERRLVEIEKLAALPDTPSEIHELAALNLEKYMHDAEERFETVENDNDGDEDTHVITDLSAVLSTHEQILSDLQADFEKKNIEVRRHNEDASERDENIVATSTVSTAVTTAREVKKESDRHEDSPKKTEKEEHSFVPATTTVAVVATTTAAVVHSEHIKKALETVRESIKDIEEKNEEYKKKNNTTESTSRDSKEVKDNTSRREESASTESSTVRIKVYNKDKEREKRQEEEIRSSRETRTPSVSTVATTTATTTEVEERHDN